MAIKIQGSTVIDNFENITVDGYAEVTQYVSGSNIKIGSDIVINNNRQLVNIADGSGELSLSGRNLTLHIGGTNQHTQDLREAFAVKNIAKFSSTNGATQHTFDVTNATTVLADYHGNAIHAVGYARWTRSDSNGNPNPYGSNWRYVGVCNNEDHGGDYVWGPGGDETYGMGSHPSGEGIVACQANALFDIRVAMLDENTMHWQVYDDAASGSRVVLMAY